MGIYVLYIRNGLTLQFGPLNSEDKKKSASFKLLCYKWGQWVGGGEVGVAANIAGWSR